MDAHCRDGNPDSTGYEAIEAEVRSRIYSLLADGFRRPDEGLFAYFTSGYMHAWRNITGLMEEGGGFQLLLGRLEGALSSMGHEGLLDEYTELFEPQGRLLSPPYETEYTKETPHHSLTEPAQMADIAGFYRAFGLVVSESTPERVDHIAAELEFMYFLTYKESIAFKENNREHIRILRYAERRFLNDHLGRWTGRFRRRVAESLDGGFYSTLTDLLDRWVEAERVYLQ